MQLVPIEQESSFESVDETFRERFRKKCDAINVIRVAVSMEIGIGIELLLIIENALKAFNKAGFVDD